MSDQQRLRDSRSCADRSAPKPRNDTEAAIRFLCAFHGPGARWQLIAISRGQIEVQFFDESLIEDAKAWIEDRNARADIYFNVNPLRPEYEARKKASKADVAAAAYLHVDIDPPKGVEVEAWREATLKKIEKLKLPRPTFWVDSGRAFWLFWKLREPTTNFDEVESRNQAIAAAVGDSADHCWNIDRIARLPGSVNYKTEKLASIVASEPELTYWPAAFPVASRQRSDKANFDDLPNDFSDVDLCELGLSDNDDWFTDYLPLNADPKVVIEQTRGKWIVEAGELSGMRRGDIDKLKGLLSRCSDRGRLAYARLASEVPRQFVAIGTTNNREYLKDQTGNRRFWPVSIERFNVDELRHDRDQLWAEAAARETKKESIRLDPSLWGSRRHRTDEADCGAPVPRNLGTSLR